MWSEGLGKADKGLGLPFHMIQSMIVQHFIALERGENGGEKDISDP